MHYKRLSIGLIVAALILTRPAMSQAGSSQTVNIQPVVTVSSWPFQRQAPLRIQTLLDEVGRLAHPVDPAAVVTWREELEDKNTKPLQASVNHIEIGEYVLAHDEDPLQAMKEFSISQQLMPSDPVLSGLARYDTALAEFKHGAFQISCDEFQALLKTNLTGFNRKYCALLMRHAGACAGYHEQNAEAGIPEPPFLDPLCGPAALASSLKALHLPSSRDAINRWC